MKERTIHSTKQITAYLPTLKVGDQLRTAYGTTMLLINITDTHEWVFINSDPVTTWLWFITHDQHPTVYVRFDQHVPMSAYLFRLYIQQRYGR